MIRGMCSSRRFGGSTRRRRVLAATLAGMAVVALALLTSVGRTAVPTEPLHADSPPAVDAVGRSADEVAAAAAAAAAAPESREAAAPQGGRESAALTRDLAAADLSHPEPAAAGALDAAAVPSQPLHPVSGKPVRAEIITCPACRLNALPKVKRFVKELATHFTPALNINYVSGEDPRLHLYEADVEVANIDIANDDEAQIIRRLAAHGIHPREVTEEIRQLLDTDRAPSGAEDAVSTLATTTSQRPADVPTPGGHSAARASGDPASLPDAPATD